MIFLICFIVIVVTIWIVSEVIGTTLDYLDMRKNQ